MTQPVDLDALEKVYADNLVGPGEVVRLAKSAHPSVILSRSSFGRMVSELRALRAERDRLKELCGTCFDIFEDWHVVDPYIHSELMPKLKECKAALGDKPGEGEHGR